jgi:uncharacterized protein YndB with AHSA1/START domain
MEPITIKTNINAGKQKVWDYINDPKHIVNWNFAHESWFCPSSENDLQVGGKFKNRMEAKDGSFGFDLEGVYDDIKDLDVIKYHLADGRKVETKFEDNNDRTTTLVQTFDPESQNPVEMQKGGWQAILANFKKYVEEN